MMIPLSYAMGQAWAMRVMAARQQAETEVLRKFPKIVIGSAGWDRAVANRRTRILKRAPR